jgi:hypothetical protein
LFLLTLAIDHHYVTGDLWVHKLINLIWKFNRLLWDTHNVDHHGHTLLQNQEICQDRLQTTVQVLDDPSPLMLTTDRDIFDLPIETRLRDPDPDRLKLWNNRAKPIVATSIKEATKKLKCTFHSITNFFTHTHTHTLKDPMTDPAPPDCTPHENAPPN